MTAKTPVPAVPTAAIDLFSPWALLGELGQHQLAVAAQSASALFRGFDALRAAQQETVHEAASQYLAAARLMCAPYQPAEVMAVESELLESDAEDVGSYWQKLTTTALQSQVELMSNASRFLNGATGPGMKPALAAAPAKPAVQSRPRARRPGSR